MLLKSGEVNGLKAFLDPWMSQTNAYSLAALICAFNIAQGDRVR